MQTVRVLGDTPQPGQFSRGTFEDNLGATPSNALNEALERVFLIGTGGSAEP